MPHGTYSRVNRLIHFAGDLLLLNLSAAAAYAIRFGALDGFGAGPYNALLLAHNAAWLLVALLFSLYDVPRVERLRFTLLRLLRAVALHVLIIAAFWVTQKAYYYSRLQLAGTYALFVVLLTVWRLGYTMLLRHYRYHGYNYRRVVILGNNPQAHQLQRIFTRRPEYGYRLLRVFDPAELGPNTLAEVTDFCRHNQIEELYCSLDSLSKEQVEALVDFADNYLVRILLVPDLHGFERDDLTITLYDNVPVLPVRQYPLDDPSNRFLKRLFDIVFSATFLLLIGSWLFPLLALAVRLDSRGPAFFRQKRSGLAGKAFWCLKFRTMRVNTDSDSRQATRNDDRITRLGRFLRRTNLDELPQFWNVLTGDMSVVGPRPHMLAHTEQYSGLIDGYMIRHIVKPGITGLAQARGWRGETPTVQYMRNRVKLDRLYVDSWSIWLDIRIVVETVLNMLKGEENAH